MLYYLTNSLLIQDNHPDYYLVLGAIKRLGLSVVESNHLVSGDYDILKKVSEWFCNDFELSPLFSKLVENYATQGIPSFINYYIEIVLGNPIIRTDGKRIIAQLHPCDISRSENIAAASLIVEDLNDACFYEHVLDWYIRRNKICANFKYDKVHGGGGRITDVIKEELGKKHVAISIIDTDKRYPTYDINKKDTYKKCKRLGRRAVYYKFQPLDVHEIENLIPVNYIDKLPDWQTETGRIKRKSFEYLRAKAEDILPYFDIKKGIRKDKIIEDVEYRKFAQQCYELNAELFAVDSDFNSYLDSRAEKDIVYYGLIEGLMKKVLDIIKNGEMPEPSLYEFQSINWCIISENMINWFVARNKESLY